MIMMRVELFLIADLECTEIILNGMVEDFGGYTSSKATGVWQDNDGVGIEDEIILITVFVEDTLENRQVINATMEAYRIDADQESVLYVINGNDANFITE